MKRTLSLTALAVAASASALVPSAPAAATTGPAVEIKVGQTLTIERPAITGVSTTFQAATGGVLGVGVLVSTATADDCAGEAFGCEVIPVSFPVPDPDDPDAIEAAGYVLEVELSWDSGQSVENLPEVGTLRQNRLEAYVFQDPPIRNANGDPNYTINSAGANPAAMTAVNPTSNKFEIVVANMHGVNNGYTLKLSLSDRKSNEFDPTEYTNDKGGNSGGGYVQPQPPTFPPVDQGFGGGVAPPITPGTPVQAPGSPVAKPIVVPNIADGKPDPTLLAGTRVIIPNGLGKTGAVNVSSKVNTAQTDDSSTLAVTIGLLALPVLSLVTAFVLLARRRNAGNAPAAA